MKKLICIILGLFLFTCSYGQAIINRSGPANTVQDARWMSQYNAFLPRYNDTTAANLQKGIDSCGAIIFTYDIAALWFRSCSNGSKQWVQILPAGSPTPGGQAWVNPINVNLFTDASLNASFGTFGPNGIYFKTNNTTRWYLDRNGIAPETGTSVGIGIDPSDSNRITYFSGSGTTPTWQQTLTAGSTLTQSNDITGAFAFSFTDPTSFTINKSGTARLQINTGTSSLRTSGGNAVLLLSSGTANLTGNTSVTLQSSNSEVGIYPDSILINPPIGFLKIDTINNETFQNTLMGWTSTSGTNRGKVGYITAGTGIDITAGAINTKWTTSGNDIYNNNSGNVGIGTTAPTQLLSLGTAGSTSGIFNIAGSTSGTITFQPQAAAGTYNWNWPTTAGTSGYFLTSGGGGSSPMTWTDPSTITPNVRDIQYIETNTFSALTGYTAVGSPTYSVTGGKVVFTGTGSGSVSNITQYIRNDLGVLDECNTIQGTVTLDAAPDANSYGVSIGFKTYTTYGSTQSLTAGIVCATGANFGKPFIYSAYSSTVYYGTANTDLNNGDVIRLSLVTSGWTLRLLVQNFTQGWEESLDLPNVGGFTPLTHNGSYPSFFHNGGNASLDSFKYTINAPVIRDILFIGNSITYGQSATTVAKRWVNLVGNTVNNVMSGGGGEVTADFITRLPEIVAINPKRVILHDLAGNDIAQAISSATWQANLITIRNTLNDAGIQVIWTNGQPRTGLDLTAQKTFIEGEATFAGDLIIDTWAAMLGTGTNPVSAYMADATHPNDLGMAATANAVNTALGFATNIGLRFGVNTAFADIGTGSIYGNSSYGLTLRARTGASADLTWFDVAGNAVLWIPTGTYDVATQGKFGAGLMGGSISATMHLKAGSTAASSAPLKFNSGSVMTTAEIGAMEYTTPQLTFTNGAGIRQELFQGQQSRVSTQYDNTTTTLGNVTGLTANVAAGKIYRFEAKLYTTSDVAGGIKVAIGGTATATAIRYEGLTTDAGLTTQSRSAALGTAVGAVTAVTAAYVTITGTITVNAAGTLTVQAAANAATGTTSVLTGSTFVITEML